MTVVVRNDSVSRVAKSSIAGTFIDLFAGCGGLSLGLMNAGWRGLFAIEKEENAFETLKFNLIENEAGPAFEWPSWLPKTPYNVKRFLKNYGRHLAKLRGKIDLVAGGPPCQGFSFAGRRKRSDPRNRIFELYVEVVRIIRPRLLLFENVKGIATEFGKSKRKARRGKPIGRPAKPFSMRVRKALEGIGYEVFEDCMSASDFGVAQLRPRHFFIGVDRSACAADPCDPFAMIRARQKTFLENKGLSVEQPVTVEEALSDLIVSGKKRIPCDDSPTFDQIFYGQPISPYQKLLHGDLGPIAPNSLRLPRHKSATRDRFADILKTCTKGKGLSQEDRDRLGILKHCIVPLDPNKPSHTLTSLPDDFLHYSEARILTVREYARLQSFPDWYAFKGKYTTGGKRRKHECPRYTQVANAVPPFVAEAVGSALSDLREILCQAATRQGGPVSVRLVNGPGLVIRDSEEPENFGTPA